MYFPLPLSETGVLLIQPSADRPSVHWYLNLGNLIGLHNAWQGLGISCETTQPFLLEYLAFELREHRRNQESARK